MITKQFFALFAALLLSISSIQADIPDPYRSITVLPFDGEGWFSLANRAKLEEFIQAFNPSVAIEVGAWLGCSTRFIASKMQDKAKVYAVDTWLGSIEHQQDPRLPFLYQQFLSNVIHTGLTDKIIPIRMRSLEASQALNVQADLIYIDAAHDTESVKQDILVWYPHLTQDGILCGDDWGWATVRAGVVQAAQALGLQIFAVDNFWWLE